MGEDPTCHRQFLLAEFNALRQEILLLKERRAKLLALALTGIPILIGLAEELDLMVLSVLCPLLAFSYGLMFLCEHNGAMRAGSYIRDYIEPLLKNDDEVGWEQFLYENAGRVRGPEKDHRATVLTILAIYYVAGAFLAAIQIRQEYGQVGAVVCTAILGIMFLCSASLFWVRFRWTT